MGYDDALWGRLELRRRASLPGFSYRDRAVGGELMGALFYTWNTTGWRRRGWYAGIITACGQPGLFMGSLLSSLMHRFLTEGEALDETLSSYAARGAGSKVGSGVAAPTSSVSYMVGPY
jgi:hypothetical protein